MDYLYVYPVSSTQRDYNPRHMAAKLPNEYSERSIRVLKGLEPVKQRPGMYTRTDNPLHVIQEVLDKIGRAHV